MGFMELSDCSYPMAVPNPSTQASQYTRNRRETSTTASQLQKTTIGGVASSAKIFRANISSGRKKQITSLAEERINRTEPLRQVGRKNAVVVDTADQCTDLLQILRNRYSDQHGHFFRVWA